MTDKDGGGTAFTPSPMDKWVRVGKSPIEYFGARQETLLTKPPHYYLTGDEGSPCDKPEPIRCGKFKWQIEKMPPETKEDIEAKFDPDVEIKRIMGIDTDEFKKQCEDVERGES